MKAHIIIIDDDEALRTMLSQVLHRSDYKVTSYPYAKASLPNLLMQQPDLIVLDISEEDGGIEWQFLQMLKMEESTASIPIVIMVTPLQLSVEIKDYLLTRYINVVYKSFKLTAFLRLVEHTLSQASQVEGIFSSDHTLPILVVDDTEDILESIISVLTLEGYQTVGVTNGKVALDAVSHTEHSLILLDIAMPIMNGFEFLIAYYRQLRPHSPVIVLTGEKNIQTRLFPPFVVDVISKPFEMSHLLNLVGRYAQPDMS